MKVFFERVEFANQFYQKKMRASKWVIIFQNKQKFLLMIRSIFRSLKGYLPRHGNCAWKVHFSKFWTIHNKKGFIIIIQSEFDYLLISGFKIACNYHYHNSTVIHWEVSHKFCHAVLRDGCLVSSKRTLWIFEANDEFQSIWTSKLSKQ